MGPAFVSFVTLVSFVASAAPARAEIVFFNSGRTLSVKNHRVDGESVVLALRNGGEIVCESSIIARIGPDEVPYPEPEPVAVEQPVLVVQEAVAVPYGDIINKFAAEQGTTSLQFIAQVIAPTQQPAVFDTTRDAISALQAGQVDGLVLDLPTASYTQYSVQNGVLIGKFAPTKPPEQFGLLFQKGSSLVACANKAIDALKADGTLEQLQQRWLKSYADVPDITG